VALGIPGFDKTITSGLLLAVIHILLSGL